MRKQEQKDKEMVGKQDGKCNQHNCYRKATDGMVLGKSEVWFCDKHIGGALGL